MTENGPDKPAPEPKNPYKEGTKKYLIAKALFSGEEDRGKICREVVVKKGTIYAVTSELKSMGLLRDMSKTEKPATSSTAAIVVASQKPSPERSEYRSSDKASKEMPSGEGDRKPSGEEKPSRKIDSEDAEDSEKVVRKPSEARNTATLSEDEIVEKVVSRFASILGVGKDGGKILENLPGRELPLEDVELVGEKVNYKIALNPEIFYRYSIFKAQVARRGGKSWEGSLGDFIDMATKDILGVYGLYPTVMTTRGKSVMVELPTAMVNYQER